MPCFILQKGSLGPSREVCTGMYRCIQVRNKCSVLYSMKTLSTNIIKFKCWGGLNPLTPRSNLSLQYSFTIQQAGNENAQM